MPFDSVHIDLLAPISGNLNDSAEDSIWSIKRATYLPYDGQDHFRSKWSIIISCFFTITACAWVSIHPNVPAMLSKKDSEILWWRCLHSMWSGRIILVFIFIIFPEFLLGWAIVQYIMTESVKVGQIAGWTRKHAFFAIMGGFHIYSSGPKRPLRPSYLEEVIGMVERGSIELPSLEEIDEKSKSRGGGGLLIKAVVLLQASWFLVQCLARTITPSEFNSQTQTMRISRLEILTIAYIMMAFCMYLAWWDKPLNVNRPIPLPRTMGFQFSPFSRPTRFHTVSSFRVMLGWYHQDFVQRVKDIVSGFEAENGTRDTHVPRFYGGRRYNNKVGLSLICVCLLASAFAGINCIAWSYESSTLIELGLWRLASIAGIAFFLHIPVTFLFLDAVWEHWHRMPYSTFLAWTTILWAVIYVFFRVTSIVIAIRELNAAPTQLGIYEAIPWVELIPHV